MPSNPSHEAFHVANQPCLSVADAASKSLTVYVFGYPIQINRIIMSSPSLGVTQEDGRDDGKDVHMWNA
ncbi:hypothetical protein N7488_005319 [Penicillium malachiteum]|nr:hypothetical protein N7488_005319 [Penicillium malachiteum]